MNLDIYFWQALIMLIASEVLNAFTAWSDDNLNC